MINTQMSSVVENYGIFHLTQIRLRSKRNRTRKVLE